MRREVGVIVIRIRIEKFDLKYRGMKNTIKCLFLATQSSQN
jgi:hypothetical protein